MAKFCKYEKHGGTCKKTGTYCNLGACPYEEMVDYTPVRRGWWITYEFGFFKCSECGHEGIENKYNYCPYCAARMDKEVTDDKKQPEEAPGK